MVAADRFLRRFQAVRHLLGHRRADARLHVVHARAPLRAPATSRPCTWSPSRWCWCLGAATLLLHDKRFIQWKPTVLLALTAAVFLGSTVIGKTAAGAAHARGRVQGAARDLGPRLACAQCPLGGLVRAAGGGEHLCGAKLRRGVWVNFKVFGITCGDDPVHDPPGLWLNSKIGPPHRAPRRRDRRPRREERLREQLISAIRARSSSPSRTKATCTPAMRGRRWREPLSRAHRRRGVSRHSARGAPPPGVCGARRPA